MLDTSDPIRDAAASALSQIIEPLLELMLDAGVTVQEVCCLIRNGAVRSASARILGQHRRLSKSRVAIMTGLSRTEVNRIMRLGLLHGQERRHIEHPARRLLAAWFDDSHFLNSAGKPIVLPIFGRNRSFEQLVRAHGTGIPVRAMLDELLDIGAIEQLPDQTIKARSRVPAFKGLTTRAIDSVGERGRDLLRTLTSNLRKDPPLLFETTAQVKDADLEKISLLQREIMEQGNSFIQGANSLLSRSRVKRRNRSPRSSGCRLGVTVYYFQDRSGNDDALLSGGKITTRRNLTRRLK